MGTKRIVNGIIMFWMMPILVSAQINIKGIISDQKNQAPLIGAVVYFQELQRGCVSNENGYYEFKNMPIGKYIVQVKSIGYESIIQSINIKDTTTLDFKMQETIFELHEIVTTGIGRSTELKLSPVSIKSVDKDYLNLQTSSNLIDALKTVPGISQISSGVAISKPVIRGLGYNRILTLVDGIRQEGQQWGDEHGIEIDEFGVERVEIVKGPGSLVYGSDGLAGVINFISPSAMSNGRSEINYNANYQTNNQLFSNSISSAGTKHDFSWNLIATDKFAKDYKNAADGSVYNSGFEEEDYAAMLGINKRWGYSRLSISNFDQKVGLVEGERDSIGGFIKNTLNRINLPFQRITHQKITLSTFIALANSSLNIDLALQNNKRKEYAEPNIPELFFNLTTFTYHAKFNFQNKRNWDMSTGLSGMVQNNSNLGLAFLIPAYLQNDLGLYFISEKFIKPNLLFSLGLRADYRKLNTQKLLLNENGEVVPIDSLNYILKFNSLTKNSFNFSAAAGLSYQYSDKLNFKLNLSRGFRTPNVSELSSNGIHEGSFRYELGNENLKSEFNHQLDFALDYHSEHIKVEWSPFVNLINNYIYVEKLKGASGGDSVLDLQDPAPAFKFVQSNAFLFGSEIFIDVHPHPIDWLHIENSFSFVNAINLKATDSTKYLPFIPAPHYRLDLRGQKKSVGKYFKNAFVKISLDYYSTQSRFFSAYETETATPSYVLIGAGIGADLNNVIKGKGVLKLLLSFENLNDEVYQNHLSRLKYAPVNPLTGRQGVFNMGRNVSLKLIYKLSD